MAGIVLKGAALKKALKDELVAILEDDYFSLNSVGDKVDSEVTEGIFETIEVIAGELNRWSQDRQVVTKAPDGRLYSWDYKRGSGDSPHIGPAEYGKPEVVEVEAVEKTIVIVEYHVV